MKKYIIAITAENVEKIEAHAIALFEITGKDKEKSDFKKAKYLVNFTQDYEIPDMVQDQESGTPEPLPAK